MPISFLKLWFKWAAAAGYAIKISCESDSFSEQKSSQNQLCDYNKLSGSVDKYQQKKKISKRKAIADQITHNRQINPDTNTNQTPNYAKMLLKS